MEKRTGPARFLWLLLPLLPALLSPLLLRGDWLNFLAWWAALLVPALIWMPSCARLFGFRGDAGFLFAKPLALAVSSLAVWTLSYLHLLPFNRLVILAVLAAGVAVNVLPRRSRLALVSLSKSPRLLRQMALGELMFGVVLLFASYARALKPAIESIPEKFMDYGYMMSLMRTEWLPGKDLWLAGESFNYYYYGQYVYTWLTRLSGLTPAVTYNLGMATTFALTFILSYAVVYSWTDHFLADRSRAREDLWLAGESFNYYYYGQYVYTWLTRLSGLTPAVTYNLGMATTFALTFILSYAVVYSWTDHFLADRSRAREDGRHRHTAAPAAAGLLAGVMVQIAGNAHSFFYDEKSPGNAFLLFLRTVGIDVGTKIDRFFFPDSTRFIGYNPDVPDKTIHEFPFYSFLVADLHPHLINLAFVLLFLGVMLVLYRSDRLRLTARGAWTLRARLMGKEDPAWLRTELRAITRRAGSWASEPALVVAGVLLGIFTMCNFWDLVIYFAVAGLVLLLSNLRGYGALAGGESIPVFTVQMLLVLLPFLVASSPLVALALYAAAFVGSCLLTLLAADALTMAGAQMSLLFLISNAVSLPFSMAFQPMSKEIALASAHSRPYQLAILWGVHVGVGLVFLLRTLWMRRRGKEPPWPDAVEARGPVSRLLLGIRPIDLLVSGIFIYGVFLILLPELVFVVDIYRGSYSRANTMFKFTYQAFVLLSLVMAYVTVRFWVGAADRPERRGRRLLALLTTLALLIPLHYPFSASTITWSKSYSSVFFSGLDGSWQIGTIDSAVIPGSRENELADDLACIRWFNDNVAGQPVILEMFGKSYRDNCRISVFTGLPTVLGWETHEHLWRTSKQTPDAWGSVVSPRQREILDFYSYRDDGSAKAFLKKYQVRYVVVGGMERAIAGRLVENDGYTHSAFQIDDTRIRALGEVVFEQPTLYVVRIQENLLN